MSAVLGADEIPTSSVARLTGREEQRFRDGRHRSLQFWTEARAVMPRGVPSSFQDSAPYPIFMERARGSRIWDVDGNEYVDLHTGFGVMVLGHANPKLANRNGVLLIFDEVKTGVTVAAGGATERFEVNPDLVALAKAIGGGLPCGAVGGRADVMGVIEDKRVAQLDTFNGNPLTMAASRVTLCEILDASAYAHFDALAEALQGGLEAVIADHSLPFHVTTLLARGCMTYRRDRVRNYRDYLEVDKSLAYLSWLYQCNRGLLMAPAAEENWTLSVQHSVADVQRYVDKFAEMARDLRSASN